MVKGKKLPKKCVLIVDDNSSDSIAEMIERRSYFALPYSDSNQAIEDIKNGIEYDLALVDIAFESSRVDGVEVIKELKLKYPSKPVLVISCYSDKPTMADGVFSKPLFPNKLENMLRIYLGYEK